MARIRTIKPGFFQDEDLSELGPDTHLLAAGLLCYADDEGYFKANPKLIKGEIFPIRDTIKPIEEMLSDLERVGYVRLFSGTDGKSYGIIVKFTEHQVISHSKPSKIRPLDASSNSTGTIPDESILKGKEGKGIEGNRKVPTNPNHSLRELANRVVQQAAIPSSSALEEIVGRSIQAYGKDKNIPDDDAAAYIIGRIHEERSLGKRITRFWFENGGYHPDAPVKVKNKHSAADEMRKQLGIQ